MNFSNSSSPLLDRWREWRDKVMPGMRVNYDGKTYNVRYRIDIGNDNRESHRRLVLARKRKEDWMLDICTYRGDIKLFFCEVIDLRSPQSKSRERTIRHKSQQFRVFYEDTTTANQLSDTGEKLTGWFWHKGYETSDRRLQLWLQQYEGSDAEAILRYSVGLHEVQLSR